MRERELKKEWTEVSQVTDSTLTECLTVSRDRGREHRESERRVSDEESERQRAEFGVFVWSELKEGLIFSSNDAFCTSFFWILAWIGHFGGFGRYGWYYRFMPIRPDSAQIGQSWSRVSASRLKKNKSHVAWRNGTRGQRHLSRVTVSDAGVAPLVPHPCFTRHFPHLIIFNL